MKRAADGDYPSDVAGLVNYMDTNSNRQIKLAQQRQREADAIEEEQEEENEYEQERKAYVKIRTERERDFAVGGGGGEGKGDKIRDGIVGIGDLLFAAIGLGSSDKPEKTFDEKTK